MSSKFVHIDALDSPITFHPIFRRITGSVAAAVFLSRAWHWTKGETTRERGGWFYKTGKEWEQETALSRSEQETARKRLVALGIMEEEKRGVPARMWFRLDVDRLVTLINESVESENALQTSLPEHSKLECGNPANCDETFPQTNTRLTTQKTSQTTGATQNTDKEDAKRMHAEAVGIVMEFYRIMGGKQPPNLGPDIKSAKRYMTLGGDVSMLGDYIAFLRGLTWMTSAITVHTLAAEKLFAQFWAEQNQPKRKRKTLPTL